MRRREFIALASGAAAWPLAARAQEARRLGILMTGNGSETDARSYLAILMQGLAKLGWVDGQNLRIEIRWSGGDVSLMRAYATDLVELFKPDVLLSSSTANLIALQRATTIIPIVFVTVSDPVEQGFVPNLTRPGGNITGFARSEFSLAGKWADLLKQMAPSIARLALVFNPESTPQSKLYLNAAQIAAPSLGIEVVTAQLRNADEIESTMAGLSRDRNVGLIFPPDSFVRLRAKQIVEAAARYRLPAIYAMDAYMTEGGLMQYFDDTSEQYRLAPFYVDRILKGTKPGDLPIQLPTKFRFVVNRKTAAALGIELPLAILLAADEVIE